MHQDTTHTAGKQKDTSQAKVMRVKATEKQEDNISNKLHYNLQHDNKENGLGAISLENLML